MPGSRTSQSLSVVIMEGSPSMVHVRLPLSTSTSLAELLPVATWM